MYELRRGENFHLVECDCLINNRVMERITCITIGRQLGTNLLYIVHRHDYNTNGTWGTYIYMYM